ncbi:DNA damage-binding protein CMR1 isoform X1 [Setaria italica]|uniref:DNA damage-binding protein CMR1 isoform X1 n=1 Tax=Setaria italica TaxID=4555 RepID=UPI0003513408|nr:DNA damage-binding protein CMR1 isoform X1 [Setaria italica]
MLGSCRSYGGAVPTANDDLTQFVRRRTCPTRTPLPPPPPHQPSALTALSGFLNVDNFDDSCVLDHNNRTGRWLSTFKAIWSWSDSNLFVGNMKRVIDVISVDRSEKSLSTSYTASLESEHMTAIPCRFLLHPYKVGHLAGASSSGKVFLWTRV